jgi:hypothetical protein
MTRTKISLFRMVLATIVGAGFLFGSEQISITTPGSFVTEAHAIIGRPLTPMSYAGVARRTTARAYGAYGAPVVVVAPMAVRPVCMQVVNPYGQITTVCR